MSSTHNYREIHALLTSAPAIHLSSETLSFFAFFRVTVKWNLKLNEFNISIIGANMIQLNTNNEFLANHLQSNKRFCHKYHKCKKNENNCFHSKCTTLQNNRMLTFWHFIIWHFVSFLLLVCCHFSSIFTPEKRNTETRNINGCSGYIIQQRWIRGNGNILFTKIVLLHVQTKYVLNVKGFG